MNQCKTKIKLSDESAAPLGCLLGRALLSREYSSLFYDAKAVELVQKIDYDFSTSEVPFRGVMFNIFLKSYLPEFGLLTLRAKQFDEKEKEYIAEHTNASVVNIGAASTRPSTVSITDRSAGTTSTFLLSLMSEDSYCQNLTE